MQVMEQETFFSEKSSFLNQNYKKYGTSNHNNLKRNQTMEVLIRHDLSKTDTLQGIAIQYGCSVSFDDKMKKRNHPVRSQLDNTIYEVI
jgi:hypothetical protein